MGTSKFNDGGNPAIDWNPIQGEVEIPLFSSFYRNWDKLLADESLGLYTEFTFLSTKNLQKELANPFPVWT